MRSTGSKLNSFTTKTASIQLGGNDTAQSKTGKYNRLQSPSRSNDTKFQQSKSANASGSKSKIKASPSQSKQEATSESSEVQGLSIQNVSQASAGQNTLGVKSKGDASSVSKSRNISQDKKTQQSKAVGGKSTASGARNHSPSQNKNTPPQQQKSQQQQQPQSVIQSESDSDSEKPQQYRQKQDDEPSPHKRSTKRTLSKNMGLPNQYQSAGSRKAQTIMMGSGQGMNFDEFRSKGLQRQTTQNYEAPGGKIMNNENSEFLQVSEKVQNIKTFVRFRPTNKLEQELSDQGIGQVNVSFPNDKTVKTHHDNNTYNFDKIYKHDVSQQQVYKEVFAEQLEDALNGYNATLFAYGPTGSGKTWTMFGPDLEDKNKKGIIPRMADYLFEKIEQQTQDVEYSVKVSMLEIYRENLLDLLRSEKTDLKIKETPKKGVYICGLSWNDITCTKDLLDIIQEGYDCKKTRETKLNEYSSRSHTIVQVEIVIKHNQGAEKQGRLNLIDLAGSEKVWKSQAEGESLEEAKKINLSLSCLGNVINALTQKSSHIPYRDSKLTRILQESLGGNYKTHIIVACSPHTYMQEETTMALRFASRAKTIKNHFNMNIKQSQETLRMIIDQLRSELAATKSELNHYKKVLESTREELSRQPLQNRDALRVIDECMVQIQQQIALPVAGSSNALDEEDQQVAIQFLSDKKPNDGKLISIETRQLKEQIGEKDQKIEELELQLLENKKKLLDVQQRYTDLQEEKNQIEMKYSKEKSENQYKEFKIDILNKQLQALVQKVCKNEQDFAQILKERKELTESKIEDYLKKELKFQEIKLSDYFKNSCNFNFDLEFQKLEEVQKNMRTLTLQECDQNMLKTFASDIQNLSETFVMQSAVIPQDLNQSFIGNLDFGATITSNQKGLVKTIEFPNQVEQLQSKGPLSKDLQLILLKQQVINSHIINQHLVRTINALEWKQVIEYGKYKMNSNLNTILSGHVQILEKLLKSSLDTHRKLRKRFDQIEFEHTQVRNQLLNKHMDGHHNPKSSKINAAAVKRRQSIRYSKVVKSPKTSDQDHLLNFQQMSLNSDFGWVVDVQRAVEDHDSNMQFQLIYNQEGLKKVQDELKRKNELLKKCWELSNLQKLSNGQADTPLSNNMEKDEQLLEEQKEKERLQNKVMSLDQEVNTIRAASNQYKKAFIEEKKNRLNTKKLMEELEIALRNNLREENETWQSTISTIKEQYEREIMLRQVESSKLQEKFQSLCYHALNSVQKLKTKQSIEKTDIEVLQNDLVKMNDVIQNQGKQDQPKSQTKGGYNASSSQRDSGKKRLY